MGKDQAKTQSSDNGVVKKKLGEYTVKEFSIRGITVRVLESSRVKIDSKEVAMLVKNIEAGNAWIKDPTFQVKTCFISITRNQFLKYKGQPVIELDHEHFEAGNGIHEMGHAIFDYYQNSKMAPADAALKLVYFFLQMSKTSKVKVTIREKGGKTTEGTIQAGLIVADPSLWSKTLFSEHPFENVDEYFASIREAILVNRAGLDQAITKMSKIDPAVKTLSGALIKFIDALQKNENSGKPLSDDLRNEAIKVLKKLEPPVNLENSETFNGYGGRLLRLTVEPQNEVPRHPRLAPPPIRRPTSPLKNGVVEEPEEHPSFFGKIFHSISSALGLSDDSITNTAPLPPFNPPPFRGVPTLPSPPVSSTFIRRIPNSATNPLGQIALQQLDQVNRQREIMQQMQRTNQERTRQQLQNQQREQTLREQQEMSRRQQTEREQVQRQQLQNQQRLSMQQQQDRTRHDQMERDRQMQDQRRRDEQMRQDRARMEEQQRQQLQQRQQQQMTMRARPTFDRSIPLPTSGPRFSGGGNYNPNGMFAGLWKPTPPPPPPPSSPAGHWAQVTQWAGRPVSGPKIWDGGSRD